MDITNDVSAVLSTDTLFSVVISPGKLVMLMDLTQLAHSSTFARKREHLAEATEKDLALLKKTVGECSLTAAKELAIQQKQEAALPDGDYPIKVFFFTSADEAKQLARSNLSEGVFCVFGERKTKAA